MANSVDPDQTAPIGAVCSGSTLFASVLLKFVSNIRQLFAADGFSRRHFQMHFFLGALRVNLLKPNGFPHNNQLDKSISNFRVIEW